MRISEMLWPFLKLGLTAFGGPAAHIAMMEDEFITRRKWMTREHFLDLVGATNLIPGPNSTEMVMHIGYERAGLPGLFTAGTCFILPSVVCTGILAAFYTTYGTLPQLQPLLDGVKPVVVVLIAAALYKLGLQALRGTLLSLLAVAVLLSSLAGLPEIPALFIWGVVGMLAQRPWRALLGKGAKLVTLLTLWSSRKAWAAPLASGAIDTVKAESGQIFMIFLKIGAVLYGSGYVLFAFLEGELVRERGLLSQAQILDAIAIGQFTPGPVLSSATFIGYLLAGWQGAIIATVGIFLPSFVFVLLLQKLIRRMRESEWLSAFLDAINVAALALMGSVLIRMACEVMTSSQSWLIAALAALTILRLKMNAAYALLGGACLSWVFATIG